MKVEALKSINIRSQMSGNSGKDQSFAKMLELAQKRKAADKK